MQLSVAAGAAVWAFSALFTLTTASISAPRTEPALQLPTGKPFDIHTAVPFTHIWVNPRTGSDDRSGSTRAEALQTFNAAWERIPEAVTLTQGFYIHILPGTFTGEQVPIYWAGRWGTHDAPIIIKAHKGRGTVNFPEINIFNCRYVYFIKVSMYNPETSNVFHAEKCVGLLLRGVTIVGAAPETYGVQEAMKVNQCQGIYVENSDISGGWNNAIDWVAVQYGHVLRSKLHWASWCIYFKGGSAYIIVAQNEIYDCGESGFAAGQGTGFEYMEQPWTKYETYDVKVYNNVIHDVWGAGLGVYGSYSVLMAYNTLYRVGERAHLVEVKFGDRSCAGDEDKVSNCQTYFQAGGWGPPTPGAQVKIPAKTVIIANNVIYNPSGFQSANQHFVVEGPTASNCANLPATVTCDTNLQIRGNVVYNGDASMALGIDENSGCQDSNPTCTAALLRSQNAINTLEPVLQDPGNGDFRPRSGSPLASFDKLWDDLPSWGAWEGDGPPGNTSNAVLVDRDGRERAGPGNTAGAYMLQ